MLKANPIYGDRYQPNSYKESRVTQPTMMKPGRDNIRLVDSIGYLRPGEKLYITGIEVKGSNVVFSVQDNGIGIAPLDMPRIFEMFYRSGRREAHAQRGSGLGLAIVKSVAERHSGKATVESQLGKGSTFYIELPLTPKKNGSNLV